MFYSVATPDWKLGEPLAPAGALLFRSRIEAAAFAPEARVVLVDVRHDAASRSIANQLRGNLTGDSWSIQAVPNRLGGLTVFGSIPAALVRSTAAAVPLLAADPELAADLQPSEFHGWDSLTMALLA